MCQGAVGAYNALKTAANDGGDNGPDACATLNAHLFQSYSDHLQDLSDSILKGMTDKMTKKIETASVDYKQQKDAQNVKNALKAAHGEKIIQEGQQMVNDINQAKADAEAKKVADAAKKAADKQQQDLMNIATVSGSMNELKDIATKEPAKAPAPTPAGQVSTALTDM